MSHQLKTTVVDNRSGPQHDVTLSWFFLRRPRPADSDGGGRRRRRSCCDEGLLPWWCVFVGWLLVLATSGVAAYFTMLYGLKYGKERSVSWLLSIAVSFFQSLLIIQPLKVTWRPRLLVIKKNTCSRSQFDESFTFFLSQPAYFFTLCAY